MWHEIPTVVYVLLDIDFILGYKCGRFRCCRWQWWQVTGMYLYLYLGCVENCSLVAIVTFTVHGERCQLWFLTAGHCSTIANSHMRPWYVVMILICKCASLRCCRCSILQNPWCQEVFAICKCKTLWPTHRLGSRWAKYKSLWYLSSHVADWRRWSRYDSHEVLTSLL